MSSVIDISWLALGLFLVTLLVPVMIFRRYQLSLERDLAVSVARMVLQLLLVGAYLEYLFELNSLVVNLVWLTAMTLIGASAIISKAKLPKQSLIIPVVSGLVVGLVPILVIVCLWLIKPEPFYNAQYLIPLAGMLLGNSLSGNIISLQNFFTALKERRDEYEAAISLGANPRYATLSFVRAAIQKSLAPSLASMSTCGLVTLPGMMTGQILGGASPIVAIKYQVMIMIAIFVTLSVSVALTLELVVRKGIDSNGKVLIKPLPH